MSKRRQDLDLRLRFNSRVLLECELLAYCASLEFFKSYSSIAMPLPSFEIFFVGSCSYASE